MKDTVTNTLLFLLIFSFVALVYVGAYTVYLTLVPGGKGLFFASPYTTALFPALLFSLFFTQFRAVHRPGRFVVTYSLLATAFFLLLTLSFPLLLQAPAVRSPDATPLIPGRFLTLEDQSKLYSPRDGHQQGQFSQGTLLIPAQPPMALQKNLQFDPLNQRFLFEGPGAPPRALPELSPERQYFQYPPLLESFHWDLFSIYYALRSAWTNIPALFWAQCAVITVFFMGFFCFFSLKTWPLVQGILVLVLMRLGVLFLAYSLVGLPQVIDLWLPGAGRLFWRDWIPVFLIGLAGAFLFFMTILTKPHRKDRLA